MTKLAAIQSSFIPWRGYFNLIRTVDKFIFYENTQYTRRDWRNRNKIKTSNGVAWITVPIQSKGNYETKLCDIKLSETPWRKKQLSLIQHAYKKTPFFDDIYPIISEVIEDNSVNGLSDLNIALIKNICRYLGFKTEFIIDTDLIDQTFINLSKTEKLLYFCQVTNSKQYFTGPSAANYMETSILTNAKVDVIFFEYQQAKFYDQLWGKFEKDLSILDLLFNLGDDTPDFL